MSNGRSKNILLCATVNVHFICFHLPLIKKLNEFGHKVDLVSNGENVFPDANQKFDLPFSRGPLSINNLIAFFKLLHILNMKKYDLIHTHTPNASFLIRIAKLLSKNKNTKLIYTAHGLHFYKSAPLLSWIIFYPIEYLLSFITDVFITINHEDYLTSQSFKSPQKYLINGIGLDLIKFHPPTNDEKLQQRNLLGLLRGDFAIIYTGEFNHNKNQIFIIRALADLLKRYPQVKIFFAGVGPNQELCKKLVSDLHLSNNFIFLNYRNDIEKILWAFDLAISSSLREGLPVNIMEAMAVGLPILASDNRGHRELVVNGVNGFIFSLARPTELTDQVEKILLNKELYQNLGFGSLKQVQNYSFEKIWPLLEKIYSS